MRKISEEKIMHYKVSLDKAVSYFLSCQYPDGAFLSPEDMNDSQPYNCYTLLYLAGAFSAARKYHDWLANNLIDPTDGLQRVLQDSVWATHTTYFKGWVAYGAHQCGFYDQSIRVVGSLNRFIDHEHGGVYITEKGAKRRSVTSFHHGAPVGMAMLITGNMREAHRIGEHMLRMLREQPEPHLSFYGYADGKTGDIITSGDLYDPPYLGAAGNEVIKVFDEYEMDTGHLCLDSRKDYQGWAILGPPLNFMIGMYYATGDKRYLDGCLQLFEVFFNGRDHYSTNYISSCKILQGLPQMYLETGDERIILSIEELSDFLCNTQNSKGFWGKDFLSGEELALKPEDQQQWIRISQLGDCALSIANVVKFMA